MTIEKRQLSEQNDNFIMLPTVDFCFKELMQNKEVRKGILSALLGKNPEELEDTELLPTILQPEYQDEKLGILDVRVLFADGTQTDLEMQVVQFDFWPNRVLFYLGKMYTGQIKRGEPRSEEHTSELQSLRHLVCRLLLEKKPGSSADPSSRC